MKIRILLISTIIIIQSSGVFSQCTRGLAVSVGSSASSGITTTTGNTRVDQIIRNSEAIFERLFEVSVDIKIINGSNAYASREGNGYNDGTIYLGKHLMLSEFSLKSHKALVDKMNNESVNEINNKGWKKGDVLPNFYEYPQNGETVVMAIIAHEFTHIVQYKLKSVFVQNHLQELHADYVAGGMLSYYLMNEKFKDYDFFLKDKQFENCRLAIEFSFGKKGDYYKWSPFHHGEPLQRLMATHGGMDAGINMGCYVSENVLNGLYRCALREIQNRRYETE